MIREAKSGIEKLAKSGLNFAVDTTLKIPVARWIVGGALPKEYIIKKVEGEFGINKWKAAAANTAFNLALTTTLLAFFYEVPDIEQSTTLLQKSWAYLKFGGSLAWSFKSYPANTYRIYSMIKTKEVMGDLWVEIGYRNRHTLGKPINYLFERLSRNNGKKD